MTLIHTNTLTEEQKKAAYALADACRKEEPITLSAASEDGLDYYLVYENGTAKECDVLTGFSFLFFVPQEDAADGSFYTGEYIAFVHPRHRRHGVFTAMLNAALETADQFEEAHDCQVDFCFLTDERSPAASAVLKALGAEYWYSEYKMTRPLLPGDRDYVPRVQIRPADGDGAHENGIPLPSGLYTASQSGEIIGTCALLPSNGEIYLYAFQIREDHQSQGYGKDLLLGMLALLAQSTAQTNAAAPTQTDTAAPTQTDTAAPTQTDTAAPAQTDTAAPTQANTATLTQADTAAPAQTDIAAPAQTDTATPTQTDFSSQTRVSAAAAMPVVSVQVSGINHIARHLYKKTGFRDTETLSYYIY